MDELVKKQAMKQTSETGLGVMDQVESLLHEVSVSQAVVEQTERDLIATMEANQDENGKVPFSVVKQTFDDLNAAHTKIYVEIQKPGLAAIRAKYTLDPEPQPEPEPGPDGGPNPKEAGGA